MLTISFAAGWPPGALCAPRSNGTATTIGRRCVGAGSSSLARLDGSAGTRRQTLSGDGDLDDRVEGAGAGVEGVQLLLDILRVVVVFVMLMKLAIHSGSLALPSSPLFLAVSGAQLRPLFLIPGAERLAPKHEIVVFDDGGNHPWVAPKIYLTRSRVGDMEVGNERVRLRCPVLV